MAWSRITVDLGFQIGPITIPAVMLRQRLTAILTGVALAGLVLGSSGCSQEPAAPTPTPTRAATAAPTGTVRPSPTPNPTATPIPPSIDASYQLIGPDGALHVDEVVIPEDGWLAAYPDGQGELDPAADLGHVALTAGSNPSVTLSIDPMWPERSIQLALFGGRSEDAFAPSLDTLLQVTRLEIDTPMTIPAISVADQEIMVDGLVTIERVFAPRPAWVAIYPADDHGHERLLGYAPVMAGESKNITLPIRWREAPTDLQAVILADGAPENVYDPAADRPVTVNGTPIAATFTATFPPDIVIIDQPVINSQFVADRVVSPEDGWLVVYEDGDEDGQPGFIIGSIAVKKGLNERIEVRVNPAALAPQLLVTLHEDTGTVGTFDFPGSDPPRRYQELAFFTRFRTDAGPILEGADRPLAESEADGPAIAIDLAVVDVDFWIAVQADENGRPGETILGQGWFPAGFHRDLLVSLETAPATGATIHAVLYQDNGTREEFERNQTDFPILFRRRPITLPITITP